MCLLAIVPMAAKLIRGGGSAIGDGQFPQPRLHGEPCHVIVV